MHVKYALMKLEKILSCKEKKVQRQDILHLQRHNYGGILLFTT